MANSLNWMGNSVVDSNPVRNQFREISPERTPSPALPNTGLPITPIEQQPEFQDREIPPPPFFREGPPPVMNKNYIPGYLTSLIGKVVRAEFIVGTNSFLDKAGRLIEVGVNYFVLEDLLSGALIMCDLYSVKFVNVFPS